jgi:hypothetical protein
MFFSMLRYGSAATREARASRIKNEVKVEAKSV